MGGSQEQGRRDVSPRVLRLTSTSRCRMASGLELMRRVAGRMPCSPLDQRESTRPAHPQPEDLLTADSPPGGPGPKAVLERPGSPIPCDEGEDLLKGSLARRISGKAADWRCIHAHFPVKNQVIL